MHCSVTRYTDKNNMHCLFKMKRIYKSSFALILVRWQPNLNRIVILVVHVNMWHNVPQHTAEVWKPWKKIFFISDFHSLLCLTLVHFWCISRNILLKLFSLRFSLIISLVLTSEKCDLFYFLWHPVCPIGHNPLFILHFLWIINAILLFYHQLSNLLHSP